MYFKGITNSKFNNNILYGLQVRTTVLDKYLVPSRSNILTSEYFTIIGSSCLPNIYTKLQTVHENDSTKKSDVQRYMRHNPFTPKPLRTAGDNFISK